MTDRWYYAREGRVQGPVTAAQLRQMATEGRLAPTDLIWPEGRNQKEGVPAQAAISFAQQTTTPVQNKPDWLDDVRTAFAVEKKSAPTPPKLDWLEDVRAAEEIEQELTTLEFDGDNANDDEENAKAILDELEKTPEPERATVPLAKPVESSGSLRLDLGSATTRGRVRERNEDSFLVQHVTWNTQDRRHDLALIVVADGVGGHQAGDRASGLVLRALSGALIPLTAAALGGTAPTPDVLADTLARGLQEAHRLVSQTAKDNAAYKGMGSTAVAILTYDGFASISLVGDCRVYHERAGVLTQVTRDQTLVARMVELGQLTAVEAEKHPRRNEVTQAIGTRSRIEPARSDVKLQRGDWLIASCDGLYAHVDPRALQKAIAQKGSATDLAQRLIDMANQGGGSDNCTVVAIHCE